MLNQIANQVKHHQQSFIDQGFIEADQENWIDFDTYQNSKLFQITLMDFLFELSNQHNWLSENVIQLVDEVKDGEIMQNKHYEKQIQATMASFEKQIANIRKEKNEINNDRLESMIDDLKQQNQMLCQKLDGADQDILHLSHDLQNA
jgi:hypothetical protein